MPINLNPAYEAFNRLNKGTVPFRILHEKMCRGDAARPGFAVGLYQYLKAYTSQSPASLEAFFELQLPFLLEVIISIQYYHNQILDGKGGITTPSAINNNLLEGNLLKDQLYRYIDKLELTTAQRHELTSCVRAIFEYVDIGQYIEKHCNTYEALQKGNLEHPFAAMVDAFINPACLAEVLDIIERVHPIEERYQPYLKCYVQRIYLTNAALFKLTAKLMTEWMQIEASEAQRVIRFATLFGIAQQIVNDNCDLVPFYLNNGTVEKDGVDAYSDARNRTITLPILLELQRRPNGEMARFLKSHFPDIKINQKKVFNELRAHHSIFYAMTCGKRIKKNALENLHNNNQVYSFIEDLLCGIIENNRYYKHFYNYNGSNHYTDYDKKTTSNKNQKT